MYFNYDEMTCPKIGEQKKKKIVITATTRIIEQ